MLFNPNLKQPLGSGPYLIPEPSRSTHEKSHSGDSLVSLLQQLGLPAVKSRDPRISSDNKANPLREGVTILREKRSSESDELFVLGEDDDDDSQDESFSDRLRSSCLMWVLDRSLYS